MLVLSRKEEQEISIGNAIRVKVLRLKGGAVSLGITAPKDVPISRSELDWSAGEVTIDVESPGVQKVA